MRHKALLILIVILSMSILLCKSKAFCQAKVEMIIDNSVPYVVESTVFQYGNPSNVISRLIWKKTGPIKVLQCAAKDNDNIRSDENVAISFYDNYIKWGNWKASPEFGFCSDSNGTTGPLWEAIIELGPASLKYIIEKMNIDPIIYLAFSQISKISLSTAQDKYPKLYEQAIIYEKDKYIYWWNNERMNLNKNIMTDKKTHFELKSSSEHQGNLNSILSHIYENYGIFVLPYLIPEIEKGNKEFVPIAWDMLDSIEGNKEKKKEFVSELKEKVTDPKERAAIILEVASRNEDRIKAIENMIPDYGTDSK
jgi:hypothetical protein